MALIKKAASRIVDPAFALTESNEGCQCIRQESFGLSICKPRESTEMSPVRTREIAAEALGEFLRGQSAHVVIERLFVFQPDLKVMRGGFYDDGWLKAGASHLSNRTNAE